MLLNSIILNTSNPTFGSVYRISSKYNNFDSCNDIEDFCLKHKDIHYSGKSYFNSSYPYNYETTLTISSPGKGTDMNIERFCEYRGIKYQKADFGEVLS